MASEAHETARLQAQAAAFASDAHLLREAARWRDATPEERLAETWRLSAMVPWFRRLWSADVRARAQQAEPLAADAMLLLERMKAGHGAK